MGVLRIMYILLRNNIITYINVRWLQGIVYRKRTGRYVILAAFLQGFKGFILISVSVCVCV